MTIQEYVKHNWDGLPKSTFNEDVVVIVQCNHDSDEGWGHHSYDGIGVDKTGTMVWCFSSGCSCKGSCGIEHKNSSKVLEINENLNISNPEDVNYQQLQVSFSDY